MPKLKYRPTLPRPDDPSIIDAVCEAVANGEPLTDAAAAAGIVYETIRGWRELGNAALAQARPGATLEELGSHAAFAWALKEAEAQFVRENLGYVRKAREGDKGWLPAMTLLERRRPQDFGRYNRVEQTSEQTITIRIELSAPTRQAMVQAAEQEALAQEAEYQLLEPDA